MLVFKLTLFLAIVLALFIGIVLGITALGRIVRFSNVAVLDLVGKQVLELTQGTAHVVSREVDEATRAMLLVVPKAFENEVEALLGHRDVSRLRLPPELGTGLPDVVLAAIHRRLREIPQEQREIEHDLQALSQAWCGRLASWVADLQSELDGYQAHSRFGETDMTFVLVGWVPASDFDRLISSLQETIGEAALVQRLALTPELKQRAPVGV